MPLQQREHSRRTAREGTQIPGSQSRTPDERGPLLLTLRPSPSHTRSHRRHGGQVYAVRSPVRQHTAAPRGSFSCCKTPTRCCHARYNSGCTAHSPRHTPTPARARRLQAGVTSHHTMSHLYSAPHRCETDTRKHSTSRARNMFAQCAPHCGRATHPLSAHAALGAPEALSPMPSMRRMACQTRLSHARNACHGLPPSAPATSAAFAAGTSPASRAAAALRACTCDRGCERCCKRSLLRAQPTLCGRADASRRRGQQP